MIVYLATNLVNGMQYVGITTRSLWDRIRGHKHSSSKGKGGDLTINHAIRKFGIESFSFDVVGSAVSIEDLKKQEMYYITKYKTLTPNGYNQNKGGALAGLNGGKPISIHGKKYSSRRAVSHAFGLGGSQVSVRLSKGWTIEQACGLIPHPDGRSWIKLKVDGKKFCSFREACNHFDVNERTALSRYKKGYPLEKVFSKEKFYFGKRKPEWLTGE